jgi:hypothetical protein
MSEIFGSLEEKDLSDKQTQKDVLDEIRDFVKVSLFFFSFSKLRIVHSISSARFNLILALGLERG